MGGTGSNFDFLEGHSSRLAKLGRVGERYYADDPPTALVKMRQFAALTAKQVAARYALYDDARMSFDDVLRALRSRSVLQREIADLFYHLKRTGNLTAHADKGGGRDSRQSVPGRARAAESERRAGERASGAHPRVPRLGAEGQTGQASQNLDSNAALAEGGKCHFLPQPIIRSLD